MNHQQKQQFLNLCKGFDQAMLITRAANDSLQARPMFIASLEDDGQLWFATDSDSGKVGEILAHPEVCVTMSGGDDYVAISGHARIVRDRPKVEQLWKETWKVWFPGGANDPNLVLIHLLADEGEYWSRSGTNRISYAFEAAKAYLKGERPQIDDSQHGHVKL